MLISDDAKHVVDGIAATTTTYAWMGWIPAHIATITGFLGAIWFILRIIQLLMPNRFKRLSKIIDTKGDDDDTPAI